METIIAAIVAAVVSIVGTIAAMKNNKENSESNFRDDLLERIDKQNDRIDKQSDRIKELEEQRERLRSEFTALIKQSEKEVNNWRESYYMVLDQYGKLKTAHEIMSRELEQLRKAYEKVHADYMRLSTPAS